MNKNNYINNFINEIDLTMKHLEEFGDVVYTPHIEQINKIISAYNKLKKDMKK